ncbi:UDP-4-amino-4,6-dideoxy-N-acetyl-beta-L-altrosamine N-acetyltransferase [Helicobacter fennelliae]|uniref:Flagellar protein G n=2 Tax=Helicobacter fennelliae TaxID=215 RepID=T1DWE5_9HELI|nr:UDP-4-amino-4,6-dideoxy-N-acetyl-beta-L-altrosamine N-acetyltransferase [Helicobacter fennelliae]GAD19352.1 flagellar protein G [Helicobacter fennelliae MRY12-0050]SQB99123.1 putative flagellar biosynthesis protein [Helicobacter fennelliae]STP08396.1 putative flagellar biosynthesis protein [Helicobacter fennelliae]STQ84810.1 putative flagellar biosynthesis protein [Helicobacter fennelliae]
MPKNFLYDDIYALDFCLMDTRDVRSVWEMRNDALVSHWMYSQHISFESHIEFIQSLNHDPKRIYWLFKQGVHLLGVGSLSRIDIIHKHAYIGIYKNPKDSLIHNKGTLILQTLEKIAHQEFGLHSLHLEVLDSNARAIRFYKRNGYCKEGVLKDFIKKDNAFVDTLIYGKILE